MPNMFLPGILDVKGQTSRPSFPKGKQIGNFIALALPIYSQTIPKDVQICCTTQTFRGDMGIFPAKRALPKVVRIPPVKFYCHHLDLHLQAVYKFGCKW